MKFGDMQTMIILIYLSLWFVLCSEARSLSKWRQHWPYSLPYGLINTTRFRGTISIMGVARE